MKINSRGFALIKVIVVVSILAVIGLGVSVFVINHVVAVTQCNQYSQAINLARLEIEKVQNLNYNTASFDNNIVTSSIPNYLNYGFYVERRVTYVFGGPSTPEAMKLVKVEVKKDAGSSSLVTLSIYIIRNVTFGS